MPPAWSATLPPTPTGLWRNSFQTPSSICCVLLPQSSHSCQGLNDALFSSPFSFLWICSHLSEITIVMCTDMWYVGQMCCRGISDQCGSQMPGFNFPVHEPLIFFSYITPDKSLYICCFCFPIRKPFLSGVLQSLPVQICYMIVHYHKHNVDELIRTRKQVFEIFLYVLRVTNVMYFVS